MVDDDNAAMRRREDGEPALPIRWASYGISPMLYPPMVNRIVYPLHDLRKWGGLREIRGIV